MNTNNIIAVVLVAGALIAAAIFLPKNKTEEPNTAIIQNEKGCIIGGCSGELCVEEGSGEGVSNCMYNPAFACYKNAKCERQTTGTCGWTNTPQLQACLVAAVENLPDK